MNSQERPPSHPDVAQEPAVPIDPSELQRRVIELEGLLLASRAALAEFRRRPRVGLVWQDQAETVEARLSAELPVLVEDRSLGVGEDAPRPHLLIEGENLHALATLSYTHAGQIDVIYIDPPYNTGSEDFRYNDRYVDPDDEWRHSKWLSFMSRRIRLSKELLAPGGFLAVSIDDNEAAHLTLLLHQIFGEDNVKTVVVKMSELAGVKMAAVRNAGTIAKLKEYLLIARPGGVRNMRLESVPKTTWDDAYNLYLVNFTDQMRETIRTLRAQPEVSLNDVQQLEATLRDVKVVNARKQAKAEGVAVPDDCEYERWCRANAWRIAQSTNGGGSIMAMVRDRQEREGLPNQELVGIRTPRGHLYIALTKNARTLLIADDHLTTIPGDLWTDISTTALSREGGVSFTNGKKPLALLRRIIGAHPNIDAVVLDFFAGSASTGQAVAELNAADGGNRQSILVTSNENGICRDVALPRMKGVLTGNLADGRAVEALRGTLRYFRCDFVSMTRNRDALLNRLARSAADLVAIREGTLSRVDCNEGRWEVRTDTLGRFTVIWCDWTTDGLPELLEQYSASTESAVYLFLFEGEPDSETLSLCEGWRVEALPEPLRAALERAHRRGQK